MSSIGHNSGIPDPEQHAIAQSWLAASAPRTVGEDIVAACGKRMLEFGSQRAREVLMDAMLCDPRADLSHVKVTWQLLRHVNNKLGYSYPSAETIALRTGLAKKTVQNRLYEILGWGYFERSGRGGDMNFAPKPPGGLTFDQLSVAVSSGESLARIRAQLYGIETARSVAEYRRRAA